MSNSLPYTHGRSCRAARSLNLWVQGKCAESPGTPEGDRTLMDYLLKPLRKTAMDSFGER